MQVPYLCGVELPIFAVQTSSAEVVNFADIECKDIDDAEYFGLQKSFESVAETTWHKVCMENVEGSLGRPHGVFGIV